MTERNEDGRAVSREKQENSRTELVSGLVAEIGRAHV